MSTRCKEVELFTTGLKPTRCEQPFNWTYVNKMRVDRTFRNWIYVNKMLTAFQLDLCQQDTNTLSIGLLSTRCEQVQLFSTGLKSTRCQQPFSWTYVYKMLAGKTFLNCTYVKKMRAAFQLELYQQDANSLSIGHISTRFE